MTTTTIKKCPTCNGRRRMFRTNGGLCAVNCGGKPIACPTCSGKGHLVETPVNPHEGQSFDQFLKEEGMLETCEAAAKKQVRKRNGGTIKRNSNESSSTK